MLLRLVCHDLGNYDLTGGIKGVVYGVTYIFSIDSYSKEEDLDFSQLREFTFLVIPSVDYKLYQNTHKPIAKIEGYSRLHIDRKLRRNLLQVIFENKISSMIQLIVEEKIYVIQQRIVSCAY